MISYWLDTINDLYEETEVLASYDELPGYRVASVSSGQTYDSLVYAENTLRF